MAYSVQQVVVFDTLANMPTAAAGAASAGLCFVMDTGRFYTWSGSAFVSADDPQVVQITSSATPSINSDVTDQFEITALVVAITSVTVTGSPRDGQILRVRIKDSGGPRALAWGAQFVAGATALLTTTAAGKTHLSTFIYDFAATKWVCVYADATGY